MWVSTMLVRGSKWKPQTVSSSMARVTTRPAFRAKGLQQLELERQQLDLCAVPQHAPLEAVQRQDAGPEHGGLGPPPGTPRQGVDAGPKLGQGEGLDQVVVAPALQPGDAVAHRAQRRDEQDRRVEALASERLDQAQPVQAGQHPVDHQHVEAALPRPAQARGAVGGEADRPAALPKPRGHLGGQGRLVFNDQDVQAATLCCRVPARLVSASERRWIQI